MERPSTRARAAASARIGMVVRTAGARRRPVNSAGVPTHARTRAPPHARGTVPRAMTAVLFAHPRCDTCRNARRWLDAHRVAYEIVDLTTRAPTPAELRAIQQASGLPWRKLFNTAGQSYRAGGFASRIAAMDDAAMLDALAGDGLLVKRPIFTRGELALVGFSSDAYARALA